MMPISTDWVASTSIAIYDIEGGQLVFKSYYKIPHTQSNTENCLAHNGSLIPVKGKDIMVQAWYQGGVPVLASTSSTCATRGSPRLSDFSD